MRYSQLGSFMLRVTFTFLSLALMLTIGIGAAGATSATATTANSSHRILFLKSAIDFDPITKTVTLPLFKGLTPDGKVTWYIVTESSNAADAGARGINFSAKLANALGTSAVQKVSIVNGLVKFAGTVDFSLTRIVVPSKPNGFPPIRFHPGAAGDAKYSPLITTGNGIVLNASQVANHTGLHDDVLNIDFKARKVTLGLFQGFYDDHPILYLHMDASIPLVAAIEGSTFAPNLNALPGEGSPSLTTSAREAIIPVVNGPRGITNPQRQGLDSFLLGQGDPKNITEANPADAAYAPMWDISPVVWTDKSQDNGLVKQLRSDIEAAAEFMKGNVVSFGSGPANSSIGGIQALGAVSNCPFVAELNVS